MNKIYEKTRYANIYRHSKNGNYVIRHDSTTISKINNQKIYDIKVARDYKAKLELNIKKIEQSTNSYLFKDLWNEYIYYCKEISKLSYNTLKKKNVIYNCYLKDLENFRIDKMVKENIIDFMNQVVASDKTKNEILKLLKAFVNWCYEEKNLINKKPTLGIKSIKVPKVEMKYWTIEEFKKFMTYISNQKGDLAYRIKILVLIELHLGDRIGETRALTWSSISEEHSTIRISHSINYNNKSKDFLSNTKNYNSDRIVDVSNLLIKDLLKYKQYLIQQQININDIIFYNYNTNKPYSDSSLRKQFYRFTEESSVSKIRLQDLRHTYVALMMNEGWELYHISKRIGHSNYSTTVNKYGHLENNLRKEVAKTTDKYISW